MPKKIQPRPGQTVKVELEITAEQRQTLDRVLARINGQRERQGLPSLTGPAELFGLPLANMVRDEIARQEQSDAVAFYRRWLEAPAMIRRRVAEMLKV